LLVLLGAFSTDTLIISYDNQSMQSVLTPIVLLKTILATHWISIISAAIFIVIAAMLITHRIAGPLFRFEKTLDTMLKKNLTDTISLRSKDEGKELAKKINDFNQDLSGTLKSLTGNSEAITTLLEQANIRSSDLPQEEQEELKSILWGIRENNKKICALCGSYTLRDE